MSLIQTIDEIQYPESDGEPMGETDVHMDWMMRIRDTLKFRYRSQQVYVGSNLLVYYEEGSPHKFVVPDVFVVKDREPGPRRTFKIWEEGRSPHIVFEVTSRSSRREDESYKPGIYARVGVEEYFLYDPTAEYLKPPLQGFRLQGDSFVRIEADGTGALDSRQLGIRFQLERGRLIMYDIEAGQTLPTEVEAAQTERQAAEARRKAAETGQRAAEARQKAAEAARDNEKIAREAAEARAAKLEAELQRLRDELEKHQEDG